MPYQKTLHIIVYVIFALLVMPIGSYGQSMNPSDGPTLGRFELKTFSTEPKMPGSLDLSPFKEFSILGSRSSKSGLGVEGDPCPKSRTEAMRMAKADAARFKRTRPSATWSTFLYYFRHKYKSCAPFLGRVYLETAHEVIQPKRRAMFQR